VHVTLLQCPANNPDSPPYAFALLNAALKDAGHEPHVFDLNIALYQRSKVEHRYNAWTTGHSQESPIEYWIEPKFVRRTLAPYDQYIDEYLDRVLEIPSPIIGFSTHTSSFWSSIEIANRIKQRDPGRIIIFGGPYCFLNHEGDHVLERHPAVDIVCFLEAERSFPELVSMIERGEDPSELNGYGFRLPDGTIRNNTIDTIHRKEPEGTFIEDLDTIPFADWSCYDLDDYEEKYLPITTSRGCIRRCSFCSEAPIWGRFRYRSAQNIADELMLQSKRYPQVKTFWFMDSLINGNLEMLEELCDILIANETAGPDGKQRGDGKFGWTGQFLVQKNMTEDLWRKVSLAGGQWFACGLENGSDRILRMMRKGYDRETAKEVIGRAHRVDPDLVSVAMFVVGHPQETEEDFQDTLDMIRFLKSLDISSSVSPCDVRKGSHLWFNRDAYDVVLPVDADYPDGNPFTWHSKDGTNTPKYRQKLLARTKELDATMLHTLKPGQKGLVEGGIIVHDFGTELHDAPAPAPSLLGKVSDVILRRRKRGADDDHEAQSGTVKTS